jgi:exoribonuclease II
MKVMYAIKVINGDKSSVLRFPTKKRAIEWMEALAKKSAVKYIGKVKVDSDRLEITNADPKKRKARKRRK